MPRGVLLVGPPGIGALGYTIQRPTEDRFLMTRQELENKMQVLLGGRAAEHLVFGEVSTGASDDWQKVTTIARAIVMRYGMHEGLGNVVCEEDRQSLLGEAGTVVLLTERRALLEAGAEQLLDKETLSETDLRALRERLAARLTIGSAAVTDVAADAAPA